MKKVLLVTASLIALGAAAPAVAADLAARPYTKAPAMIAAVYDWSGFYIGANGGLGSRHNTTGLGLSFPVRPPRAPHYNGCTPRGEGRSYSQAGAAACGAGGHGDW